METTGDSRLVDPCAEAERRGDLVPHLDRRGGIGSGDRDAERFVLVRQLSLGRHVDVADLEQPCSVPPV